MIYLVRGLPGSGKSTFAKRLAQDNGGILHLESDMYFMKNGEYVFDSAKVPKNHEWCFNAFKDAVNAGMDVIVSNTFTQKWELNPYIEYAKYASQEVKLYRCSGEYGNTHNVPQEVLKAMRERFVDIAGEIVV